MGPYTVPTGSAKAIYRMLLEDEDFLRDIVESVRAGVENNGKMALTVLESIRDTVDGKPMQGVVPHAPGAPHRDPPGPAPAGAGR